MKEQMEHAKLAEWIRRHADPAGRIDKPNQNFATNVRDPDYQGPEITILNREVGLAFESAHKLASAVEALTAFLFGEQPPLGISAMQSEPCGRVELMTTEARALVWRADAALRQVERISQQFE